MLAGIIGNFGLKDVVPDLCEFNFIYMNPEIFLLVHGG